MRSNWVFIPFAWIAWANATATPLTLSEAQELALIDQPQILAQQAVVQSQSDAAIAARQLPDPKIKLALQNVPTDSFSLSEDFMTQRTIAIEQMFPGGNKRELRGRRGEQEAAQAAAQVLTQKRMLRRDSALAWLDLFYATQSERLIREQLREARAAVDASRIAYGANKNSLEEILIAQHMTNQLRDRTLELAGQIGRARAGLRRWIGEAADRELAQILPPPQVPSLEQLKAHLPEHPEVAVYDNAIATAESDMALARQGTKPDWSIELGYSKRGSAYSDMVSVQLAFDLPVFPANRQSRDAAAKQGLVERVRSQRDDRLRSLNAELAADYAEYQATLSRIETLEKDTLPNVERRIRAAQISYQNSKIPMTSVYEAHHTELGSRQQLLAQRVALARIEARLRYLAAENMQ